MENQEAITERDRQLIELIISQPSLTDAKIAKLLGITRQAVNERRKRLEREGIIQRYVFWNIAPKLGLTKLFDIVTKDASYSQTEELIDYLVHNWKVAFTWISNSGKVISGIILTDKEEIFTKILKNEFPFIRKIEIKPVEFRKFLGQRIKRKIGNKIDLEAIAYKEFRKLSQIKSVEALLFYTDPQNAIIHMVVLRNKRFHRSISMTSTHKMIDGVCIHIRYGTYEILREMLSNKKERKWIRNLKVAFARNKQKERQIKYLIRLARHI